jgi:UDP-glucose 4-epimerase
MNSDARIDATDRPRALVTGAAGFIGSHVADRCVDLGFDVVGVDDLSGGTIENVGEGLRFIEGNVADPVFVEQLFQDYTFDYVYHLAAYAAEGLSHFIRVYNYTTNLLGSVYLINQSVLSGVRCFIFTSSIAVYGAGQLPMTEDVVPVPEDPYGISKYAVELDLAAAHAMFGMPYLIFRPHNVYGERQNIADRYRNVIGIFMNQLLQGLPMTVFGDGKQTRAFSHVDDVAPVIARAPLVAAAANQIFNVGADRPHTINDLTREVATALGLPLRVEHLPARQEVMHAFASHERARAAFNPPEPVPLSVGLPRMATWVRERGPATPVRFSNIEVAKNMPSTWAVAQD